MSTKSQGKSFLEEFGTFLKFLQTLWGILAGVSTFFPLSNILVKAIPLGYMQENSGSLEYFSPALITVLVTMATLFVILQTFGQRETLRTQKQQSALRHQAWVSFGLGILALISYLAVNFGIYGVFYAPFGIWSGDPLRLIGDVLLLLFYGAFFVLTTRAFVLLGMMEYFNQAK